MGDFTGLLFTVPRWNVFVQNFSNKVKDDNYVNLLISSKSQGQSDCKNTRANHNRVKIFHVKDRIINFCRYTYSPTISKMAGKILKIRKRFGIFSMQQRTSMLHAPYIKVTRQRSLQTNSIPFISRYLPAACYIDHLWKITFC